MNLRRMSSAAPARKEHDGPRMNEMIRDPEVRLIDENGENVGVVPVREAKAKALALGLDLVEVSPGNPPVCKIMDYGKHRYQEQKKAAEARKNQKIVEIKEIKVRPGIEEHDYQVKLKATSRFLQDGNKVKVTMRFRGREMSHSEIGLKVLNRIIEDTAADGKVELAPKIEGRQAIMVLSALK